MTYLYLTELYLALPKLVLEYKQQKHENWKTVPVKFTHCPVLSG